ncbi:MAG TPA: hypothetical protein VKF40_13590 [Burkholderiales bacterium]|nr:hypothetical protein [Burkholderiales bacterium]
MFTRQPLVAVLAAAGLLASEGTLGAQTDNVFVPELALIDGAVCRMPVTGNKLLLQLAQAGAQYPARKTEISPAAPAAAAAAKPAAGDREPPLISGLGSLTYRVTTTSKEAQRYFDQGYRLAWGFNHDEAQRAFRKAQRLDPDCAMCYWGEAWVLGPNINAPMDTKAIEPAVAAAAKARTLAARVSPGEQALIEAIGVRYSVDSKADRVQLDAAYAAAMRRAVERLPADLEVAVLYADALMNVSAWNYWEAGGKQLKAPVAELVNTLERVLKQRPDHAGAIHLYIHAVEASDNPKRAERYADRLGKLMPGAGHVVHMPSHIYYRVGRYKESLAVNNTAVKVDEAYIERHHPAGIYPLGYYPHNVHFVMVSAQMAGDASSVIESAGKLSKLIPEEAAKEILILQPVKAAPYFAHARFSDAATVLALPDPGPAFPYVQAVWRYARGVALAQRGDPAAARELAEIERIVASTDFKPFAEWKIPAKDVAQLAGHVLRGRIAQAKGDLDGAVRELQAAVKLEDSLPYMEPPYWYYPARQTLGALLVLKGEPTEAREAFAASLARTPNNAWALYGLEQAYKREGKPREARAVEERFLRAWVGDRKRLDLATL